MLLLSWLLGWCRLGLHGWRHWGLTCWGWRWGGDPRCHLLLLLLLLLLSLRGLW